MQHQYLRPQYITTALPDYVCRGAEFAHTLVLNSMNSMIHSEPILLFITYTHLEVTQSGAAGAGPCAGLTIEVAL